VHCSSCDHTSSLLFTLALHCVHSVTQCCICEGRRESPQVRMARMQLKLVLGALSIFVAAFYLGFNVSYRMASGTIGGRFWPRASAAPLKPASLISATDATFTTADCGLTFSGRKPSIPTDGSFQSHGSECLSSSVKLMPSSRVSKECTWMLDLDALPGLGFSANHQDQVVETIFDRSELPNLKRPTANLMPPIAIPQNGLKALPHPMATQDRPLE